MSTIDPVSIYIVYTIIATGFVCGLSLKSFIAAVVMLVKFILVALLILIILFAIAIAMAGPMMLWFTLPVFWFGPAVCVLLFIGFVGGMLIRKLFCYIFGFSRKRQKEPQTMSD